MLAPVDLHLIEPEYRPDIVGASVAKQPSASRGTPGCFATLAMTGGGRAGDGRESGYAPGAAYAFAAADGR